MKIIKSFGYAFTGLKHGMEEHNMKVHLIAALMVIALGFGFSITFLEWAILLLSIGLVIVTELINTSLEEICDVMAAAHKASYQRLGKPKDIGAGAVLIAAVVAACVGLIIFVPYIF